MKLYDCTTAPSPRRVRIYLAEKGIDLPLVEVDLRHGEHLGEDFRAVNPDCTVPVLELDDGRRISEIFAICQYLETVHPEPPLLGRDAFETAQVTMWNTKIEQNGLVGLSEAFRNHAKGFRDRALTGPVNYAQIPALAERGRKRAAAFFDRLDGQLADREYVVGDCFTLADITAFVAVEFAGWSKISAAEGRPNLARWYGGVSARPGMTA